MSDNYGFLAPFYQALSRAVLGRKILEANQAFLAENLTRKLIFIGGGDGMAYRPFAEFLEGSYYEKSSKMLQLSQKNLANSQLNFIHGEFSGQEKGDCFILPFMVDSLQDEEIQGLLVSIQSSISPNGKLIFSDFFAPRTLRQKILHLGMIWFFRIFAAHSRVDLPNYPVFFQKAGFKLSEEKVWEGGWIKAQIYELDSRD